MRNAAEFLLGHDNYLILTHVRPDGDTIGSAAALCLGLRQLGKQAWVYKNPQFTSRFDSVLDGICRQYANETDTLISVDISSAKMLCFGAEAFADRIELAIDHHESHNLPADRHLVDADAAACGEIVHALLKMLGVQLTPLMADALYVAVSTDTGCFKYSNTTGNTFRVAAELCDSGADTAKLSKIFFDTKSLSRLKLESRLTESVQLFAGGAVSVCTLPKAWIEELSITEDDIDSISGFSRAIEGVMIGIMIREIENGVGKISVRTGPEYNAAAICARLGGGGHAAAAGASVEGGIEQAKAAVLSVLRESGIAL